MNPTKIQMKTAAAAEAMSVSEATIKRAIRATDPNTFPPPLRAKRDGKGTLYVLVADLTAWRESWPDA